MASESNLEKNKYHFPVDGLLFLNAPENLRLIFEVIDALILCLWLLN